LRSSGLGDHLKGSFRIVPAKIMLVFTKARAYSLVGRHDDMSTGRMTDQPAGCGTRVNEVRRPRRTDTLGVRMTPNRVREVKVEAAARGMSVAALFEEIWQAYLAGRGE
jgi:hypothetical protein